MAPSKKNIRNAALRATRASKKAAEAEQQLVEEEEEVTVPTTAETSTEGAADNNNAGKEAEGNDGVQNPGTGLVPYQPQTQTTQALVIRDHSFNTIKEAITWVKTLDVKEGQEAIGELMGALETYQEGAEDAVSDLGSWIFAEAGKIGRKYEKDMRAKFWSADQTIKFSKPRRDKQAEATRRLLDEWPEIDESHRLLTRDDGIPLRANELEEMVRVAKRYSAEEAANAITHVVLNRLVARKKDNRKSATMHAVTADWKVLANMDRDEVQTQPLTVEGYNAVALEVGWHEVKVNAQGTLEEKHDLQLPGLVYGEEQEAPESKALVLAQLERDRANEKLQSAKSKKGKKGEKEAATQTSQTQTANSTTTASSGGQPAATAISGTGAVQPEVPGIVPATAQVQVVVTQPELQAPETVVTTTPEQPAVAQLQVPETDLPTAPEQPTAPYSEVSGIAPPIAPEQPAAAQSEVSGTVLPIALEPSTVVQPEVHETVLTTTGLPVGRLDISQIKARRVLCFDLLEDFGQSALIDLLA